MRLPTIVRREVLFTLAVLLLPLFACADDAEKTAAGAASVAVENSRENSLNQIQEAVERLGSEIESKQRELRSPQGKGREEQITAEIGKLSRKLESLRNAFTEVATGVDVAQLAKKGVDSFSWSNELRDLLLPLINEIKRLSSRPREIDNYHRRIDETDEALSLVTKGLGQVEQLDRGGMSKEAVRSLSALENEWQERKAQQETELKIYERKLEQRIAEQENLFESASTVFDVFFRSRVKNLLIAFLATGVVWLLLRRLHLAIQRIPRFYKARRSFKARLFNVLFLFFTGFGALVVFMSVLFLLNDWVLLTLGIMFLLGVAWSSKHALPQFWSQAAVLLNMGPVREGERLQYNGVPYGVKLVNFYSELVNPALDGGIVRLPIYDMPALRSRPSFKNEPWFPTVKGDWVLLDDDVFGEVILQTPEQVVLRLLGGTHKVYQTANFLGEDPAVLSRGFRHSVSFGIDYQHQPYITEAIPQAIQLFVSDELGARGYGDVIQRLKVEFSEAGASSLDVVVLADFPGEAAPQYRLLGRLLQRLCVDACNNNGWVIPFAQMTMHVASLPRGESGPSGA